MFSFKAAVDGEAGPFFFNFFRQFLFCNQKANV
jgi:hypothetical protein